MSHSNTNIVEGESYRHLAPELIKARSEGTAACPTPASDCYAFAMTILELVTSKKPFCECAQELEVTKLVGRGTRPGQPCDQLALLPPDASNRLWELLGGMWAHDPKTRPAMDVVHAKLEKIYALVDS